MTQKSSSIPESKQNTMTQKSSSIPESNGHRHKRVKTSSSSSSGLKTDPTQKSSSIPESSGHRHKRVKTSSSSSELKTDPPLFRCSGGGGLLKLKDEYADKSLFICTREGYKSPHVRSPPARYQPWLSSYAIRSIKLRDLLTSDSSVNPELVASIVDEDIPTREGCGVLGSKIVFASGLKPNLDPYRFGSGYGPEASTEAYAFDIHDPKQGIVKMPGNLNGGKSTPLMFEFAGKLYAVGCCSWFVVNFVSFEVFDPEQGTWSLLPSFPSDARSESYAIVGTKLFMSGKYIFGGVKNSSTWCYDLGAQDPHWRIVPSMCQGGPLPFTGQALVLDLPESEEHGNKKLLFSTKMYMPKILVHLMSTDENQENITQVLELDLVELHPHKPDECHLLHLGGNLVCLVTTREAHRSDKPGVKTVCGAAVPFQFEFDISKLHTDVKKCFTVQFLPPRKFEYHSSPDCDSCPETIGCFILSTIT